VPEGVDLRARRRKEKTSDHQTRREKKGLLAMSQKGAKFSPVLLDLFNRELESDE